MKRTPPDQLVRDELAQLKQRTELAAHSANALRDLILNHYPALTSEVTVLKETAALLEHNRQNFDRLARRTLAKP